MKKLIIFVSIFFVFLFYFVTIHPHIINLFVSDFLVLSPSSYQANLRKDKQNDVKSYSYTSLLNKEILERRSELSVDKAKELEATSEPSKIDRLFGTWNNEKKEIIHQFIIRQKEDGLSIHMWGKTNDEEISYWGNKRINLEELEETSIKLEWTLEDSKYLQKLTIYDNNLALLKTEKQFLDVSANIFSIKRLLNIGKRHIEYEFFQKTN